MSEGRTEAGTAHRVGSGIGRLVRAWRVLAPEQHLAAVAAIGLFLALFLPWYQVSVIATGGKNLVSASQTLTGWGAFSFVEAAVLLVAAGVLTLLFQRAEGRAFHLPGGDGTVITIAGMWTGLLVVWRMFDKQGTTSHGQYADTYGIEWGIFVALAVAALLAYAGSRIRAAHRPEPPLPGDSAPTDPLPQPPTYAAPADAAPTAPLPPPPRWRTPDRPVRPPRPVRAADPRATRAGRPPAPKEASTAPMGTPATPAARLPSPAPAQDQLTIPLDDDGSSGSTDLARRTHRDPGSSTNEK
jgi:hypothetical protein